MTTYQVGETVRITATITDSDGSAADPTTTTIKIVDPAGTTKVSDSAMTKTATGSYYYDYTIPSASNEGEWNYNVTGTGSGGRVTIVKSSFDVDSVT